MRESKFRGVSDETGEFVYGYVVPSISNKSMFIVEVGAGVIGNNKANKVNHDTIGQCIDSTDINGVEFYEGDLFEADILFDHPTKMFGGRYWVKCLCKIEYVNPVFTGKAIKQLDRLDMKFNLNIAAGVTIMGHRPVVGNIHQNKDLL